MQRTSIHTAQRRTRRILHEDHIDDASKMTLKAVEAQLATDLHVSLQMQEEAAANNSTSTVVMFPDGSGKLLLSARLCLTISVTHAGRAGRTCLQGISITFLLP